MRSCMSRLCLTVAILSSVSALAVSVNISSPTDNASVTSPLTLRASAVPGSGHQLTGWQVYIDGNSTSAYSAYGVSGIDTALNVPDGTHTIQVKVWDGSGNDADQTITVNVVNHGVTVDVRSPGNGATVFSPVDFEARAVSAHPITGWHIYVDGGTDPVFSKDNASSIFGSVPVSPGTHKFVVRAWDATGAFGDQTLTLNVAPPSVAVNVSSPGNDATVGSPTTIQASATSSATVTGWHIYVDSVDVFRAGQTNSISANLSMSTGTHSVVVRAWDSGGTYASQTLTLNVVHDVQVSLSSPANGASVNSPVPVQASASSSNTITGWHIYEDNAEVFSAGQTNSINASLPMSNGSHTLVIRAWDSTGAFGDQTVTVNAVSSNVTVNVITPQNNSTVNSPVEIEATAQSPDPAHDPISGWRIYVDGNDVFFQANVSSIRAPVALSPGITHTVVIRAWDTTNNTFGDQTLTLTASNPPPPPTGNAYTNIDDINPWINCGNGCANTGGGGAQATTGQALVSSPSEDGTAHQFTISGTVPFTNGYWYIERNPSNTTDLPSGVVTSQTYSFDLLIPSAVRNAPQAIEWETQQQFNNVIYNTGWQALYANGADPTKMLMRTFLYHGAHWYPTGIWLPRFTPDSFHHIQVDETVSGSTIFFDDIWVDGIKYIPIPGSSGEQHPAFSPGGALTTKFNNAVQLDLNGSDTPYDIFIDNMTLVHNP